MRTHKLTGVCVCVCVCVCVGYVNVRTQTCCYEIPHDESLMLTITQYSALGHLKNNNGVRGE